MRFWKVKPRMVSGWNSFGGLCPLGWGSLAVPDGGFWAGVKYEILSALGAFNHNFRLECTYADCRSVLDNPRLLGVGRSGM